VVGVEDMSNIAQGEDRRFTARVCGAIDNSARLSRHWFATGVRASFALGPHHDFAAVGVRRGVNSGM